MICHHLKSSWLWLLMVLGGCQLIEPQQLQGPPRPRGRIRIADISLPVTGSGSLGANWPGLAKSSVSKPISSTVHTHIPLLREDSSQKPITPSQEAVVYGNWKTEHPERPDEMEGEMDSEQQPRERVYGRLEEMLMGMPADAKHSASSEEQKAPIAPGGYQNPVYPLPGSFERSPEKAGRRRFTTQQAPQQFEVVRVNNTDPLLKAMAKQINESVETTTTVTRKNPQPSTDDNWMPLPYPYPYDTTVPAPPAPTSSMMPGFMQSSVVHPPAPTQATRSTSGQLNWPTDFIDNSSNMASTEGNDGSPGQANIDRRDESIGDPADDYKYNYEDSLNSAQMHSELSVPEAMPLNITRVGIPYEDRNAAEEPTLCVPLTVSEPSLSSDSSTPLVVEVERVYCFPLPQVEVRPGHPRPQVEQVTRSYQEEIPEMDMQPTEPPMSSDASGAEAQRRSLGLAIFLLIGWSCWI
ncbi:hypothetical protein KR009_002568 [Drosophila setifemur]|nr:hypothetical protein KR009_002568 [Drosophila setifemur]